jgi:hypothetical protein
MVGAENVKLRFLDHDAFRITVCGFVFVPRRAQTSGLLGRGLNGR